MSISKNRYWNWNRYTKELVLYKPASLFVVWGAMFFCLVVAVGLISQIF